MKRAGSASYDPDNDLLIFFWSIISKPEQSASSLDSLINVNPTFIPDLAGLYVAQLIVNDGMIESYPDTTKITTSILVLNPLPALTVIDPAQVIAGTQSLDVDISGSGFMDSTIIYVNGAQRSYTPISETQLQLTLTTQDLENPGQIEIKAYNQPPGGGYSNSMELTVIEQIKITITAPVDGSTINGSEVMVKGYITNVTDNETGVNVNGIVAALNNNEFSVNHVPLTEGENTITVTAVDTSGATVTKSITVNAVSTENYISISVNPESAAAPMDVFLRINGTFTIANPVITFDGPGTVEQLQSDDPDEHVYSINSEGIYYFTAQAVGPDGITYRDTIAITAVPLADIDNLLRAKWAVFINAMQQKDTETALNMMLSYSRDKYQIMFDLLKDQLPDIVATYVGIELESVQEGRAWYELTTMEDGSLSAYRLGFIQDTNGLWYIREF
ncbi:MAG: hypothetical protein ABIK92_20905 [Pseudomonadota bacterium]